MSNIPQGLTIAGSDSGGGAGIQADLKTFQMQGVFGTSVITAITAQNTLGVFDIHPIPLNTIQAQLEAVKNDFQIASAKNTLHLKGFEICLNSSTTAAVRTCNSQCLWNIRHISPLRFVLLNQVLRLPIHQASEFGTARLVWLSF